MGQYCDSEKLKIIFLYKHRKSSMKSLENTINIAKNLKSFKTLLLRANNVFFVFHTFWYIYIHTYIHSYSKYMLSVCLIRFMLILF